MSICDIHTCSCDFDSGTTKYLYELLWNHTYSWGPMFVDSQNLASSWGLNLWITGFGCYNARQFITSLNVSGDVNSRVRVTHEIHEHQPPTKNNDSKVVPNCPDSNIAR